MSTDLDKILSGSGINIRPQAGEVLKVEDAQRAALKYIEMGWAVTAGPGLDAWGVCSCAAGAKCRNAGKHAYAGWGADRRRVLTAEEAERYWSKDNDLWDTRPVDHVFIVPYLSGLILADVDEMETWNGLGEEFPRPETLRVGSGSGRGGHWFYRWDWAGEAGVSPFDLDVAVPSTRGKLPGGCGEVKFRGIVVAPPCFHHSGGRYVWENWGIEEIADAPEWLRRSSDGNYGQDVRASDLPARENASDWLRLHFLNDMAGLKRAGEATTARPLVIFAAAASVGEWVAAGWTSEEEVISLLLEAAAENGTLEDYGAGELTRQIKNGIRAGAESGGEAVDKW